MYKYIAFMLLELMTQCVFSQYQEDNKLKRQFDTTAFNSWPTLVIGKQNIGISNNGKYAYYTITSGLSSTTFVKSLNQQRQISFEKVRQIQFTTDSRHIIVSFAVDSLCIVNLDTYMREYITGASAFQLVGS